MRRVEFGKSQIEVASIILGCMRMNKAENPQAIIETAFNNGINFFDHADIYAAGLCESIFAENFAKTSIKRSEIFLQTKCGIKPGIAFDFSYEHIIYSVNESLKRLKTDYIDALLLHRPDTLVEPDEVAKAFSELHKAGKVKFFGVSNFTPNQIELLKLSVEQDLQVNQMQFGLMHSLMVNQGITTNMKTENSPSYDLGILDYCRTKEITIQAWSPYQYGFFEGVFIGNEKFPELNKALDEIAKIYNISSTALATSWILRHPAQMQVVLGTMNESRIKEIAKASEIQISREHWYKLYMAAGNLLP